jgi:DNA-directed RNA polymerase specialized sigma24 family protein
MGPQGSVSRWLQQLQQGEAAAAQPLWERYFPRLVELARKKLRDAPRRGTEEDVALSAFDSFCRNAAGGRFPRLADRDDLWRLLVVITARKAAHLARDERRRKRGGGAVQIDTRPEEGLGLEQILSREPTPEFAAQAAEECQRLLGLLGERELEAVALWKMEGYTVEEIAQKMGYVPRSIKRKLRVIRSLWEKEVGP